MFFWFLGMSFLLVWSIFRSPALDYRLVMLGSVLGVVELPIGSGPMHALVTPVLLLAVVMVLTVGRRLARRRWLSLVIGVFFHQVLDGSWAARDRFWWPLNGGDAFAGRVPELTHGPWTIIMEIVGLAVLAWSVDRFRLDDESIRKQFVSTGQLDRRVAAGEKIEC